jgi:hypothetical protein
MPIALELPSGGIRIGRYVLAGYIDATPCPHCGAARIYHERYDAYFCHTCNYWLEGQCTHNTSDDPCRGRPRRPLSGCLTREGRRALPVAIAVFFLGLLVLGGTALLLGAALGILAMHPAHPTWVVASYILLLMAAVPGGALLISFATASRYLLGTPKRS